MENKKVLIIDDEPDVARTMQLLLDGEGIAADIALGGKAGLKVIENYEVILLDIMMPEVSGRQVLKDMKARNLKKKVIVVSAVGLPDLMKQEFDHLYPGAGFISKPHMHEELAIEVKKALGKK